MKKSTKLSLLTLLFVSASLVTSSSACQKNEFEAAVKEFDPFIEKAFALDMTPGLAVAVVKGNDTIYARGFGYADIEAKRRVTPETMFYIASTTKSFTAFAAALLHHRGELDLDQPLSGYLPKLRLQTPLSTHDITLRDLLTHTHGIENDGPVVFRTAYTGEHHHDQLVALLEKHPPATTGGAFDYGNLGYNIASLAMDANLDIGWKDLIKREIFQPLGLKNTSGRLSKVERNLLALPYAPEEKGFRLVHYAKHDANMHAAGGHVSSALDLAEWLKVHLNSGKVNGKQIFPAEVVAETHRKQADQERELLGFQRHGWGLGWDLATFEGDTLLHRPGSFTGFFSYVSFRPQHDLGVVVLVNGGYMGAMLATTVTKYLYDRLLEKEGLAEKYDKQLAGLQGRSAQFRKRLGRGKAQRAARQQTLPNPLAAYTGVYENPELGRMTWQLVNDKLEVSMGLLWSPAEVYSAENNKFRVELTGGGEVIGFSFIAGHVESLTYRKQRFNRVGS
ncbi:serine hydrolase [candidate division KSB1 bacterium]|nr:serine hydrolase [candidate division KSB1 bacterium]